MNLEILKNIPDKLANSNRWLNWKTDSDGLGKYPCDPDGTTIGWEGGVYDISSCLKAVKVNPNLGLGFSLNDDNCYAVFDVDVKSIENGFSDEQLQLLSLYQGTYIEKSPSGLGVHIWIEVDPHEYAQLPDGCKSSKLNLEFYKTKRFITITGDMVKGCSPTISKYPKSTLDLFISHITNNSDGKDLQAGSIEGKCDHLNDLFSGDSAKCHTKEEFLERITANDEHWGDYDLISNCYDNDKGLSLDSQLDRGIDSSSYDQAMANFIFGYCENFKLSLEIFEDTERFKKLLSVTKKHANVLIGGKYFHGYSIRTMIKATDVHVRRQSIDISDLINSGLGGADLHDLGGGKGKIQELIEIDDFSKYGEILGIDLIDGSDDDRRESNEDGITELPDGIIDNLKVLMKVMRMERKNPFSRFLSKLDNHAHTNYPEILTYVAMLRLIAPIGNCFSYEGYNCCANILLGAPTGTGKNDAVSVMLNLLEYFENGYKNSLTDTHAIMNSSEKFSITQNRLTLNCSPQALYRQLVDTCGQLAPTCFLHIAECYNTFSKVSSDAAGDANEALFRFLIKLPEIMSGQNIEKVVKTSKDDQEEIVCPSICEYSETQTFRLDKLLTNSDGGNNGVLNRRIIIRIEEKQRKTIKQSSVISDANRSSKEIRDFLEVYFKKVYSIRSCCIAESLDNSFSEFQSIKAFKIVNKDDEDKLITNFIDTIDGYFKNFDEVVNGTPHERFKSTVFPRLRDNIFKMSGIICVLRNLHNINVESSRKLIPQMTLSDVRLGASLVIAPYYNLYEESKNGTYDVDGTRKNIKIMLSSFNKCIEKYTKGKNLEKIRDIKNLSTFKTRIGYLAEVIDGRVGSDLKTKEPFSSIDNSSKRFSEYTDCIDTMLNVGILQRISKIQYYKRINSACNEYGLKVHPDIFKIISEYESKKGTSEYHKTKEDLERFVTSRIYVIDYNTFNTYIEDD